VAALAERHQLDVTFDSPIDATMISDWRDLARCAGRSDLFFPPPAERPQARELRERIASAMCSNCVVRTQCRDFARDNREYGFWGGENEEERVNAGFALPAPIGIKRLRAKPNS
jgi:WhiB family transcriptional regulator, redox-sensing transcriptional regulator